MRGFGFILVAFLAFALACESASVVNSNAIRSVELNSQIARVASIITIKNTGSSSLIDYFLAVDNKMDDRMAVQHVYQEMNGEMINLEALLVSPKDASLPDDMDCKYYKIVLKEPLMVGKETNVTIFQAFTHVATPLPLVVKQKEPQMMQFFDNIYYFSPYVTEKETTRVVLPSKIVESYTEEKPMSVDENVINYGPYTDTPAFTFAELAVHYESEVPYAYATHLHKTYEISHWGQIRVEEHYSFEHDGAKLEGGFSRWDYYVQKHYSQVSAGDVSWLRATLPVEAKDGYYRDVIGNISTSHWRKEADKVVFDFRPRYPIFGGWKISLYFGYNLPLSGFLNKDKKSGQFVLNTTFGSSLDEMTVDSVTYSVILPGGSKNVQFNVPASIKLENGGEVKKDSVKKFLDMSGKPVVSVSARNIVPFTSFEFVQVSYDYSTLAMLQKPVTLVLFVFVIIVLIIGIGRVSLRLVSNGSEEIPSVEQKKKE